MSASNFRYRREINTHDGLLTLEQVLLELLLHHPADQFRCQGLLSHDRVKKYEEARPVRAALKQCVLAVPR